MGSANFELQSPWPYVISIDQLLNSQSSIIGSNTYKILKNNNKNKTLYNMFNYKAIYLSWFRV